MEEKEFLKKKKELKKEYDKRIYELSKEYVFSNINIKVGDFIQDHMGWIKVDRIDVSHGFNRDCPTATFAGSCYTSDRKRPYKNGQYRNVWGGNILKHETS